MEFPETWKLFKGFLQGKKIDKGCITVYVKVTGKYGIHFLTVHFA
jgi:hypothetical protein